jgi:hypothetical protein
VLWTGISPPLALRLAPASRCTSPASRIHGERNVSSTRHSFDSHRRRRSRRACERDGALDPRDRSVAARIGIMGRRGVLWTRPQASERPLRRSSHGQVVHHLQLPAGLRA